MDAAAIRQFLESTTWPSFTSGEVRLRDDEDGSLVIEYRPLPMTFIHCWLGFTFLVALGVVAWLEKDRMWFVAVVGLLAIITLLAIFWWLESVRRQFGPLATVNKDIKNFCGATMPRAALIGLLEVYFTAKGNAGEIDHHRVILAHDGQRRLPILWQPASRSQNPKPTLVDMEQRLGVQAESLDLPKLHRPSH